MAGEADQFLRERQQFAQYCALRVQSDLAYTPGQGFAILPPGEVSAQPVQLVLRQAQGAAEVTHGTARAVGDHRAG